MESNQIKLKINEIIQTIIQIWFDFSNLNLFDYLKNYIYFLNMFY